jgi:hypothetical protein
MSWGSTASSDHYLAFDGDGLPGPTDAWVTLGALARETSWVSSNGQASCLPGPERRTDQNQPRHGASQHDNGDSEENQAEIGR